MTEKLNSGDLFSIPLEDESFGIGVFHKYSPKALNSCICSFYANKFSTVDEIAFLDQKSLKPISIVFVTTDLLKRKTWVKVTTLKVPFNDLKLPDAQYEIAGSYKGAKIYGAGIIREFINAYYGILPWDMMHDPNYFDKLLLSNVQRPKNLIFEKD